MVNNIWESTNSLIKLRKQIKHMTPSEVREMDNEIESLKNDMLSPKFRKQLDLIRRWNSIFAPTFNNNKKKKFIEEVQNIPNSHSLDKQIKQLRELEKDQPMFHDKWNKFFNDLSELNIADLKDFYSNHVINNSTYKNHVKENTSSSDSIIINNGVINYNTNNTPTTFDKFNLLLTIISIILAISTFLASTNPNQVETNLNDWNKAVKNIR